MLCYYFDDIFRVRVRDFSDILLNRKSYRTYENILIYDISYKTFMGAKPLRARFNEIDEFTIICDGIRYFVLFASERYIMIVLDIL